uniref:Nucleolar protein 56 n=1 Tax=Dermatophagoides pteronyssinus TaxID=6956 RepID=A0A6P6Y8J9_DERPT|nr:nucleolar protein 56-like [Dermatophagoides pteronyssinus]
MNFVKDVIGPARTKAALAVADSALGKDIAVKTDVEVVNDKGTFDLIRTLRLFFTKLVDSVSEESLKQFQLGLAHSFSRAKISDDSLYRDKHCSQAVTALDTNDRLLNKLGMRLKEWYGWHFPELTKLVEGNAEYAKFVLQIRDRLKYDVKEQHDALLAVCSGDEHLCLRIEKLVKMSAGCEISEQDAENMFLIAKQIVGWAATRSNLSGYFSSIMSSVAPNLKALVGDSIACKLMSHSGGLLNLAKLPASTVQLLGAEKALFRALKARGPTPKYGLIYHASAVSKASARNKGRISRFLANKLSLASRLDAFGEHTGVYGTLFCEQVNERLQYLDAGIVPTKNLIVSDRARNLKHAQQQP